MRGGHRNLKDSTTRPENNSGQQRREDKRARPIEEKESFRWLETMRTAASNAPAPATLIQIADRDGDIYELTALAQELGENFVIRAAHDRIDVDKTMLCKPCEIRRRWERPH